MTMKTIIWILLALSLHLNAEEGRRGIPITEFTCRKSNCVCYNNAAPIKEEETGYRISNIRCSHEVYRQKLSLTRSLSLLDKNYPDAEMNELLSFPFIELSLSRLYVNVDDMQFLIHCLNFNLENISTANTLLFDLIPQIKFSNFIFKQVRFEGCPVPEEPLETLFNILSINQRKSLQFLYSPSNIILSSHVNIKRNLFSNLHKLSSLDISNNNIGALEPGVFTHLIYLEILRLSNNKISTLDQDIFKNLTSLEYLLIDNNRLVNLTHDLFSNLPSLISLNIFNNNISVLPNGVFDKLPNLQKLDISNNKFSVLPSGVFDKLPNLQKLDISNNKFSVLPSGVFDKLPNLQKLDIFNNKFSVLPSEVFDKLTNLHELDISNNNISVLPNGIFDKLSKFRKLDISNNNISVLPYGVFDELSILHELDISNNNISVLPNGVFDKLSKFRKLDISNNNISVLPSGVFDELSILHELDISNNNISVLPNGVFDKLSKFKKLDISNNNISVLPSRVFDKLSKLEKLDISNNRISVLPQGVFDNLEMLDEIWANGNTFKEFPGNLFSKTNKLTTISLQYQRSSGAMPENFWSNVSKQEEVGLRDSSILELPSHLFKNASNLRVLVLSGHKQLVYLPEQLFENCEELSVLDLSDNGLETLPLTLFLNSNKLTNLNLSRNRLMVYNEMIFFHITRLEQLNLSHNKITQIGNKCIYLLCRQNERLKSIDFSNNFLRNPDELDNYYISNEPSDQYKCHSRLKTIKFSNNNISYIDKEWIYGLELETLDLKWNNITSIPDYVLLSTVSSNMTLDLSHNQIEIVEFTATPAVRDHKYNSNKRNIILNGNPIACNCSNYDLFRFIQGKMVPLQTDEFTVIKFETNNINTCKPSNMSINIVDPTQLTCDTIIGCPSSCKCNYSPYYHQIIVNCTSANLKHMPQNLNITLEDKRAIPWNLRKTNRTIQLILRNNSIQQLLQDLPEYYALVTVLDLSFNNIKDSKHIVQQLPRLETLNLSHNHLESLSQDFIKLLSSSNISSLFLSGIKWKCDCNITDLYNFLSLNEKKIVKDSEEIICDDSSQLYKMKPEDFCPTPLKVIIVLSIILALLGVLGPLVTCLYYKYQDEIKVWLYAHKILLCWVSEKNIDSKKIYDAFVSYAEEDYGFVVKTLIPELEKSFRICHHERDFVPGEFITEQIYEKVSQSRRTIIVLTEHFLRSRWCDFEFRTAHAQAMKGCSRVIILIYGDMPPQETMPEKMRTYMSMNTYIKWGGTWFWEKIKYALPHRPARFAESDTTQNASNSMPMQNIIGSNSTQVCSATSSSQTNP